MDEAFLELSGVTKRFGRTVALDGVDLRVGADELVVVLGPTGAGKTTLLRTVAGLETPQAGTVRMGGRDVTRLAPAERDVALVFQNFSLYPSWTVRRNLSFPLRAPGRKMSADAIDERVRRAADLLGITRLLDRRATRLSGGEMQRVAIGRAIVRRPRIFLMDEPLTNLDAKLREQLRVELVVLRRELAAPMLYVTHDQTEALSMGDRVVVLSDGRVLQSGRPEEIYRRPASPTVARQLGQPAINLIPVTRKGGAWVTESGVPICPAAGESAERMLLGVRPENVAPSGGPAPAAVRVVEDMGAEKVVLADLADLSIHLLVRGDLPIAPDQEIHPKIDPDAVCLWPR